MRTIFKRILAIAAVGALMTVSAEARYFKTVVIDPGHGGYDKGAQHGMVYEKHLCLDTATRLEAYLKGMGFNTVMTRRTDKFISLAERVAIADRYKDAIFVSVHYNFTYRESAAGLETFYGNNNGSATLAQMVQQSMCRRVRGTDRGAKFARYYVIRNTKAPAILVECGFVSNPKERKGMKAAWYRDSLAKSVAEGIMRFRKNG
jgi:N-acetylmuramoyl-L-alanine amidase